MKNKIPMNTLNDDEIQYLTNLAFYLEGINEGRGDLAPLGTNTIEALWKGIKCLKELKYHEK